MEMSCLSTMAERRCTASFHVGIECQTMRRDSVVDSVMRSCEISRTSRGERVEQRACCVCALEAGSGELDSAAAVTLAVVMGAASASTWEVGVGTASEVASATASAAGVTAESALDSPGTDQDSVSEREAASGVAIGVVACGAASGSDDRC